MTRKEVFTYVGFALLFVAIGAYVAARRNVPAPVVSTPAPAVAAGPVDELFGQSMNDASGASHALGRWKGKPLVVNFWAPWCAPCVAEMPELDQLATASAARNINVIGIGIDSPSNIAEFAGRLKINYPLYVAGLSGTELARKFGNSAGGLPYTVLIGADGKVVKTYLGKLKFDELQADLNRLQP
ncbi:MAG TPA: TlpA disulfide reductase family protein [Telluria sp.]|jgi:thiol-disulfide isomerase/thioredoxin